MTGVRIACGAASAEIALRGAELTRWCVEGRDLIWEPDPAIWSATAPLLFPVVGWTRDATVRVDGQTYPLGLHGFVRDLAFAVVERTPSCVRLRCAATAQTRGLFPFDWTMEVAYELLGNALDVRLSVRNAGSRPMPYACGLHPGLCWPFAGGAAADYAIVFERAEAAEVPVITADGLFTRDKRPVPLEGRRLALSAELMAREALCFLDVGSRSLRFAHCSGDAIDCAWDGFAHVALWSRPPGRFLCVELWTGHGDFVDADGDLFAKPSMLRLAPSETKAHRARFAFTTGGVGKASPA